MTYSYKSRSSRGADKSLARPGRTQVRKHARDARDFNNIETRAFIKFFSPARQGAEANSRHSDRNINFLPGRAKDLSAPLYIVYWDMVNVWFSTGIVTCYTEEVSLLDKSNSGVILFSVHVDSSDLMSVESLVFLHTGRGEIIQILEII